VSATRFAAAVVLFAGWALVGTEPAAAQIYSWRDGKGGMVFSDHRPGEAAAATGTTFIPPEARRSRRPIFSTGAYDDLIERHAGNEGIRPDVVRAVIQAESGFNPRARSPMGAVGLMQLMPGTAAELGVVDPLDPSENIRGGVAYLGRLLTRYGNDLELALAAYNAGPAAVERYGFRVPPFAETRGYVSRITSRLGVRHQGRSTGIFKTIEEIDGRPVPRYSNVRPATQHVTVSR
jgi:hypothetical protein